MNDKGAGWIVFAWLMLLIGGALAVINGLVALLRGEFLREYGAAYVVSDATLWGWIAVGIGVLAILAAGTVWRGSGFARWFGIIVAGLSLLVQSFWAPIAPFWALSIMVIDVLVIYALVMYGGTDYTQD